MAVGKVNVGGGFPKGKEIDLSKSDFTKVYQKNIYTAYTSNVPASSKILSDNDGNVYIVQDRGLTKLSSSFALVYNRTVTTLIPQQCFISKDGSKIFITDGVTLCCCDTTTGIETVLVIRGEEVSIYDISDDNSLCYQNIRASDGSYDLLYLKRNSVGYEPPRIINNSGTGAVNSIKNILRGTFNEALNVLYCSKYSAYTITITKINLENYSTILSYSVATPTHNFSDGIFDSKGNFYLLSHGNELLKIDGETKASSWNKSMVETIMFQAKEGIVIKTMAIYPFSIMLEKLSSNGNSLYKMPIISSTYSLSKAQKGVLILNSTDSVSRLVSRVSETIKL